MPKSGQTSTNTGDLPRGNSWSLAQILCSWAADVNVIEYIAIAAIASPSNKCSVATHSNKCKMHKEKIDTFYVDERSLNNFVQLSL